MLHENVLRVTVDVVPPRANEGGFFMSVFLSVFHSMSLSLVTPDGGLTSLGLALSILAVIALVLAATWLYSRKKSSQKLSTKQLVFCAAAMALAFVTSYIKIANFPFGGSVTLFSMLFVCLIGYWYGAGVGILTGLAYGILQFLQEPYVLSFFQVCCDYILAFAGLGLAGVFAKSKKGLIKGYVFGILVRGAFHTLGGYLYWMDYMPENFPVELAQLYPIIYNYTYILAEGALTVVLLLLPPVGKALKQIKQLAVEA